MRTMNYLLSLALLFIMGSCSKEAPVESEDLSAVEYRSRFNQNEQEDTQEIFEIDLHQYYVLGQIVKLERKKSELEEEIEGGNDDQIPALEALMENMREHAETLASILEKSCSYLKFREEQLKMEVILGNRDAKKALEEVQEKLRGCGLSIAIYTKEVMETRVMAVVGGKIGGNCDPGIDFDRCVPIMDKGTLLINSIDREGGGKEVYLKSRDGRTISKGEIVGDHEELEGVSQTSIELEPIENGILEFKGDNASFAQMVTIE